MRNKFFILILLFIGILLIYVPQSCENNNEFDLYGTRECDTTDITWESTIREILKRNCVECHNDKLASGNVRHDSYAAEMIVVTDGRLRGVVNHLDGFVKMPKDREKLPECELKQINLWLDRGAPEK